MITQELIQFIRQQLAAGKTRQYISDLLHTNGWAMSDIDEGFDEAAPATAASPASPAATEAAPATMTATEAVTVANLAPTSAFSTSESPSEKAADSVELYRDQLGQPEQPAAQPAQPAQPVQQIIQPLSQPQVTYQSQHSSWAEPAQSARPVQPIQPIQPAEPVQQVRQAQPEQAYAAYAPTLGQAPAQMQMQGQMPPMQAQPAARSHSFRNPNGLTALGILLVLSVVGSLLSFALGSARGIVLPGSAGTVIGIEALALLVTNLLSAALLSLATKILKVEGASFPKAITFTSVGFVVGMLLAQTISLGLPGLAAVLLGLASWFAWFIFYYRERFLKALFVFLLDLVFSVVLGIVLALAVAGLGLGIAKYFSFVGSLGDPSVRQGISLPVLSADGMSESEQPSAPVVKKENSDAAVVALMNGALLQADAYFKDHKSSYGSSAQSDFCHDTKDGLLSIPAQNASDGSVVSSCFTGPKYPSKTFTVIYGSHVDTGTYFCIDQSGFIGNIGMLEGNKTFSAGVKCQ